MTSTIFQNRDFLKVFSNMQNNGVSLIRSMLEESFRAELEKELTRGPFEQATEGIASVKQNFERFAFLWHVEGMPRLNELRLQTEVVVRSAGAMIANLDAWEAKDIVIQRYSQDGYLSGHRDLKRHPGVIAIYTVVGSCIFEMLAGREGPVLESHQVYPGDLILLRGANASEDKKYPRPFHRVGGSVSDRYRISATFRDNDCPEKPIAGFSYRNILQGDE